MITIQKAVKQLKRRNEFNKTPYNDMNERRVSSSRAEIDPTISRRLKLPL